MLTFFPNVLILNYVSTFLVYIKESKEYVIMFLKSQTVSMLTHTHTYINIHTHTYLNVFSHSFCYF